MSTFNCVLDLSFGESSSGPRLEDLGMHPLVYLGQCISHPFIMQEMSALAGHYTVSLAFNIDADSAF